MRDKMESANTERAQGTTYHDIKDMQPYGTTNTRIIDTCAWTPFGWVVHRNVKLDPLILGMITDHLPACATTLHIRPTTRPSTFASPLAQRYDALHYRTGGPAHIGGAGK
jgi:hypothetical protein